MFQPPRMTTNNVLLALSDTSTYPSLSTHEPILRSGCMSTEEDILIFKASNPYSLCKDLPWGGGQASQWACPDAS